jgi:hypothetical protein
MLSSAKAQRQRMMTADHIAVTPYYGAPQSVAEQIASFA